MFSANILLILFLIAIVHLIVNIVLTKEILDWEVEVKRCVLLLAFVWCIPFVGAFYYARKTGRENASSSDNISSGVSAGLMGADEIFNPSAKYVIEAHQEEYSDVREDDQPYKGDTHKDLFIKANSKEDRSSKG